MAAQAGGGGRGGAGTGGIGRAVPGGVSQLGRQIAQSTQATRHVAEVLCVCVHACVCVHVSVWEEGGYRSQFQSPQSRGMGWDGGQARLAMGK